MVIPHVAIVTSFLLAGSNPSAWEAITSQSEATHKAAARSSGSGRAGSSLSVASHTEKRLHLVFQPVYRSVYKSSWVWDRGSMKASWVAQLVEEYPSLVALETEVLRMRFGTWALHVVSPTMLLLLIPCFLGAMIRWVNGLVLADNVYVDTDIWLSYTTPAVGLSCRSMTVLAYVAGQTILIILWLIDWLFWKRNKTGSIKLPDEERQWISPAAAAWYLVFLLSTSISFFTAIIGTSQSCPSNEHRSHADTCCSIYAHGPVQ